MTTHTKHSTIHKETSVEKQHDTMGHDQHAAHQHSQHGVDHRGHEDLFRRKFWLSLLLSIPILLYSPMLQQWFGFSMPVFPGSDWIGLAFAIVVFIVGGAPFLNMALPELRNRKPGMMALISLAISVSFAYSMYAAFTAPDSGFFWEMATLIDIMLLGHWIEMRSVRQASGALQQLAKLLPDTANMVMPDGSVMEVPIADLKQGNVVLVRPGGNIPVDGVVIHGESKVDQSMITGESIAIEKTVNDSVVAGTINGAGSMRVKVNATGEETTLAGIMRLVAEAQKSKSGTQILADKAAGWLFYLALGVAVLTAIAWTFAIGFNIDVLKRVVSVLVIACPHALGLAIPLVVAISTSMGASSGILVRDRLALETARTIDTVVFDKTGTLTEGRFGVVGVEVAEGWDIDTALAITAGAEGDSEHLLAKALRDEVERRRVTPVAVSNFTAIKGRGVKARYNGQDIYVGGPRLLELLEVRPPEILQSFTNSAQKAGHSVISLIMGQKVVAQFALADVVRQESIEAVTAIQNMDIEVVMLTGDSHAVASGVAAALGISKFYAEVLPEDKEVRVAQLQANGKRVAMVGDGINDAPALVRADVGIAIGSGTDVAIESAGIILIKNNPLDVVKIVSLSRATYRKMIQNLIWATGYNIVALPLAAGVLAPWGILLSPAVGALLMSLSTVVVAINAQLLRKTDLAV